MSLNFFSLSPGLTSFPFAFTSHISEKSRNSLWLLADCRSQNISLKRFWKMTRNLTVESCVRLQISHVLIHLSVRGLCCSVVVLIRKCSVIVNLTQCLTGHDVCQGPFSDLTALQWNLLPAEGKVKSPRDKEYRSSSGLCVVAKLQGVVDGSSEIKALHLWWVGNPLRHVKVSLSMKLNRRPRQYGWEW